MSKKKLVLREFSEEVYLLLLDKHQKMEELLNDCKNWYDVKKGWWDEFDTEFSRYKIPSNCIITVTIDNEELQTISSV